MKVKRYQAATSREALAKVKAELGADAVILSNRPAKGGVEILALANKDVGIVTETPAPAAIERPLKEFAKRIEPVRAEPVAAKPDPAYAGLQRELKEMRGMVEQQLASIAWSEDARRNPLRAQFTRELLTAGFSAPLARKVTAALPNEPSEQRARAWLRAILARNLACTPEHNSPVDRGGVFALVGPTGVGKTTTVAKIAARCVVRFGAQSVALVSTDGYRIGAQDQLRIYAKILGVAVHAAQDPAALSHALESLSAKRLVLIDTVGMGQRDVRLAEQLDLLADERVQRIVLLNAASQIETLEEVARAYRGRGLAGAILTKLDEARRSGGALDVAMRHRLALPYVTDGQRVPEDIRAPQPAELVEHALAGVADSPFALRDDELFTLRAA